MQSFTGKTFLNLADSEYRSVISNAFIFDKQNWIKGLFFINVNVMMPLSSIG